MRRLLKTGRLGLAFACGIAAASLAFAPSALADTTISTLGSWDGVTGIAPFGNEPTLTPAYGQVITAPGKDVILESFSFEMKLPTELVFRGEVYAWDKSSLEPTGNALFESSTTSTTDNTVYQKITFSTGGIRLEARHKYVLFATTLKDTNETTTYGSWGTVPATTYGGGDFVYANQTTFDPGLFSSPWDVASPSDDLAFEATFSPGNLTATADVQSGNGDCGIDHPELPVIGQVTFSRSGNTLTVLLTLSGANPDTVYNLRLYADSCTWLVTPKSVATDSSGNAKARFRANVAGYSNFFLDADYAGGNDTPYVHLP
jgi:hypothetical protein